MIPFNRNMESAFTQALRDFPFLYEMYMLSSCTMEDFILEENIDFSKYKVDLDEIFMEGSVPKKIDSTNAFANEINDIVRNKIEPYMNQVMEYISEYSSSTQKDSVLDSIISTIDIINDNSLFVIKKIVKRIKDDDREFNRYGIQMAALNEESERIDKLNELKSIVNDSKIVFAIATNVFKSVLNKKFMNILSSFMTRTKGEISIDHLKRMKAKVDVLKDIKLNTLPKLYKEIRSNEIELNSIQKVMKADREIDEDIKNLQTNFKNIRENEPGYIDELKDIILKGYGKVMKATGTVFSLNIVSSIGPLKKYILKPIFNTLKNNLGRITPLFAKTLDYFKGAISSGSIPFTMGAMVFLYGAVKKILNIKKQQETVKQRLDILKHKATTLSNDPLYKDQVKRLKEEIEIFENKLDNMKENEVEFSKDFSKSVKNLKTQNKMGGSNNE